MTKIMTAEQIQVRMIEIARHEWNIKETHDNEILPGLIEQKAQLEKELKGIKSLISVYQSGKSPKREHLQADFDAHLQAGGAVDVHPRIKIRRNSKWMYDQKKALAWAQENGIRDVIRVKESLVKLAFDKLIDEGHYQDVEQVKSVSIILPSVMGDLLIESQEKE